MHKVHCIVTFTMEDDGGLIPGEVVDHKMVKKVAMNYCDFLTDTVYTDNMATDMQVEVDCTILD